KAEFVLNPRGELMLTVCKPQELGEDMVWLSCSCLKEAKTSFIDGDNGTEILEAVRPSGDNGGDSIA
ncbi:hypothetical protein M3J43_25270, partial [Escherichia coli]|uniref:hypothetical protein n=1 Tax=Escherichia coli TaxID=562 RepID=UPI00200DBBDD